MARLLLKLIPWLCWAATVCCYGAVALMAFCFLLVGKLNDGNIQLLLLRTLCLAVGLTVVSLFVHIFCRRQRRGREGVRS
ncbi:MAG: hypothetical protein K5764_02565 [Prevotella sp.]|nr:hypothetical protein [Prevotella sp.]